ncbi:MAG: SH3 domain-containing protein [Chloroflexi bacterium]|nr:SH3 domain-containing protein [Chloroflexota bacterium]
MAKDTAPPEQVTLPTATATPVGGPTATITRTPTLVPVTVTVLYNPLNLRAGPGLNFEIVEVLADQEGLQMPVLARVQGLPWLLVRYEDQQLWVFEDGVLLAEGSDITIVPFVTPPPPPTENPALADLQATNTVVAATPGGFETATAQAFFEPTDLPDGTAGEAAAVPEGPLPTFTPPEPYVPPEVIPAPPDSAPQTSTGIPPAALIIGMGAFGIFTVIVGIARRFF